MSGTNGPRLVDYTHKRAGANDLQEGYKPKFRISILCVQISIQIFSEEFLTSLVQYFGLMGRDAWSLGVSRLFERITFTLDSFLTHFPLRNKAIHCVPPKRRKPLMQRGSLTSQLDPETSVTSPYKHRHSRSTTSSVRLTSNSARLPYM